MKSTLYFLVQVEDSYNNYITTGDGTKLSVNNSISSVENINRVGKVVAAPKGVKVKVGDFLLFHHNICRESWGLKGKRRRSNFLVKDDIFFVPAMEVFMYMEEGGTDWKALDPFVFIKPIKAEKVKLSNGLEVEEESYKGMKPLVGILAYPNEELLKQGAKEGDMIAFQQDSEHEYNIKGEIYYKMRTNDVLGVI